MHDRNADVRKTGSNYWPHLTMPVTAVKAVVDVLYKQKSSWTGFLGTPQPLLGRAMTGKSALTCDGVQR